jgi:hypothetical protein
LDDAVQWWGARGSLSVDANIAKLPTVFDVEEG